MSRPYPIRFTMQRKGVDALDILLDFLEPVFIIENAGWTRNFAALQGKKSQESFVDFKIF